MPVTLPVSIIVMGIARQCVEVVVRIARYLYLALVWVVVMPLATSLLLAMYSYGYGGLSELRRATSFMIVSSIASGLSITAMTVLLTMGLLLLCDYMASHGLLILRQPAGLPDDTQEPFGAEEQPQYQVRADLDTLTIGGADASHDDVSETAQSTASATRRRSGAETSSWLQHVTPREYRAYLRRRDLLRERVSFPSERASIRRRSLLRVPSSAAIDEQGAINEAPSLAGDVSPGRDSSPPEDEAGGGLQMEISKCLVSTREEESNGGGGGSPTGRQSLAASGIRNCGEDWQEKHRMFRWTERPLV